MVNLKEVSTQELIEELIRRLKARQGQIKTEIEDYQDALTRPRFSRKTHKTAKLISKADAMVTDLLLLALLVVCSVFFWRRLRSFEDNLRGPYSLRSTSGGYVHGY